VLDNVFFNAAGVPALGKTACKNIQFLRPKIVVLRMLQPIREISAGF